MALAAVSLSAWGLRAFVTLHHFPPKGQERLSAPVGCPVPPCASGMWKLSCITVADGPQASGNLTE